MEHRGYIILNHDLTDTESKKIQNSKYLRKYSKFCLKILGGSHFLSLKEAIMILYPEYHNIKAHEVENIFAQKYAILILNDYDSYLSNPDFKYVSFQLPNYLDGISKEQLDFLKKELKQWKSYSEIVNIGLWPNELQSEILYWMSIKKFNSFLEQNLFILEKYIDLVEQQLNHKNELVKKITL